MIHEAAEEILHQLGLQIADSSDLNLVFVNQRRTAAQIQRDHGEGFIHGHDEVACAIDSLAIAERLGDKLAEHDADVFDSVVLIDIQIARWP